MIKGRVSGNGNIIILGGLKGEFNLKGRIKIAQPAKIKGEVKADVISVNGNVEGSLIAGESVHLDKTAVIEGRIDTPRLSMMEGAIFNGEIKMSSQSSKASQSISPDSSRLSQSSLPSAGKSTNS
jgi:cytoskeletal protein CcmA (bactofilin family)